MKAKITLSTEKNILRINNDAALAFKIYSIKMSIIRFGYKVADVVVEIDDSVSDNEVIISENIIKKLNLPMTEEYLIRVENNEIILGPYIGIYTNPQTEMTSWKVERLKSFITKFKEEINGVMIAFTHEDIDYENFEVNAFYYDSKQDLWLRRKMPLPTVIHRYGDMSKKIRNKLRSLYGNNLFNYDEMDKWSEISAILKDEVAKKYVSDTRLCTDEGLFQEFLHKYDDFYFKPIKGRKGRGIHRIIRSNHQYFLTTTGIKDYKKETFNSSKELIKHLYEDIHSNNFILQRTIKLTIDDRVIDFRVRFEKNIENEWELSIFAGRVSGKGGVVSNRSAGGEVLPPKEVLMKYYKFDEPKADAVIEELVHAGKVISQAVERAHLTYLKCAVDLGVEPDGSIYHIESNVKAPNDLTTRSFEGYEGLDLACSLNSQFSKRMAGFKDVDNKLYFESTYEQEIYKEKNQLYKITFGGSNKTNETIELIKMIFTNYKIKIKKENIKKFHYQFIVNSNELELIEVIKKIKERDAEGIIRTALIEVVQRKNKVTKTNTNLEIDKLRKENRSLSKEINQMKSSTSWKLSKPIRMLGKILKKN